MCWLTPKISCTTTIPPRGAPDGLARYAANLCPSSAVRVRVSPMRSSWLGMRRCYQDLGPASSEVDGTPIAARRAEECDMVKRHSYPTRDPGGEISGATQDMK